MKVFRVEIKTRSHGPLVLEVLASDGIEALTEARGLFHPRYGADEAKVIPHHGDTFWGNFARSSLRGSA